jgi:hypothetical protein
VMKRQLRLSLAFVPLACRTLPNHSTFLSTQATSPPLTALNP